ncbi:CRISPR-associated endonuclease Cas2 [Candidatus Daviesbacteria bacterium]|nr:CRISPR-associated endonuclease Cas2 [Candidatus Daviesbacteria bacterium]
MGTLRKGLSNWILLVLEKTVDGVIRVDDFINNPGLYAYRDGWNYPLNKSALSQALRILRENGFIEFLDDQKLVGRLTDEGRAEAIWAKIRVQDEPWDGKWRLVIFDIPEQRRIARDLLRSKLKQWGFINLQRSVWACKKNCTKQLKDFIKGVGIKEWVMVIESTDIDR